MVRSRIPYDGPDRCQILYLIKCYNYAHYDVNHILTDETATEDLIKVQSLDTFEQEQNLRNTRLELELHTLIKDLERIRKGGNQQEMGKIAKDSIAQAFRKVSELIEFNGHTFAGQKAKNEAKENERRIQFVRQQRFEKEAREAKERTDAEKQAREAKYKRDAELAAQKAKEAKDRAEREKKAAPEVPATLEIPRYTQRPMRPRNQSRPNSAHVHFETRSPTNQNRPVSPDENQRGPNNRNNTAYQNRPMSPSNRNQQASPNKMNTWNQPISPKNNHKPQEPVNRLQKARPKPSTEVKEERLQKAHEVGLALASEVRKHD